VTAIIWKDLGIKLAQPVVQMFVVDQEGNILLIHRSSNIRSAPNVWSTPSGLHDIGLSVPAMIAKELNEEFNIGNDVIEEPTPMFQYENIAGDDPSLEQYHWLITVWKVEVSSFANLQNMEPAKHDKIEFATYRDFESPMFYKAFNFHPTYEKALKKHFMVQDPNPFGEPDDITEESKKDFSNKEENQIV
jgi:ADP-ribose pyrophosphatase YjhB (NUDIX family)